jgi:short-subunit dehydrogenase
LSGRNEFALKEVANEIKQLGSEAVVVAGDLADAATIDRIVDSAIKSFKRIDALILGAGVSMGFRFEEMTNMSAARRIMEVNFFANVALTNKVLPYVLYTPLHHCPRKLDSIKILSVFSHLIQSRGRLAAITSGVGVVVPVATRTIYGASKSALQSFLESLRWEIESKHGVFITIVMPDTTKTNQNVNRIGPDGSNSATKFSWDLSKGYSPDFVARLALVGIQKGDREVAFDWPMTRILRSLIPNWIEWAGNISASRLTSK